MTRQFNLHSIAALLLLFLASCISQNKTTDYTRYVDPFIGTGGHGHTFPGATLPFGMVQISPDTRWENWDGSSGYHYSDSTIMGFSQTHLSGTGAPEYCDVLLMPTVGKLQMMPGDESNSLSGYRSAFQHENEEASPGYYSVLLDDYNVRAELSATKRTGLHRYTFPESDQSHIIIDLKNRDHVLESHIEFLSDTEVRGFRKSRRWAKEQFVYFHARFSKPFDSYGIFLNDSIPIDENKAEGKNIRAHVDFSTSPNEQVLVEVGISAVNLKGAKLNLDSESQNWNFEKTVKLAKSEWNKFLSKIEVEGGTLREKRIFYSGLYHTAIAPNLFLDVDGNYRGVDHKVHQAKGFKNYTVFSLWDTFRATMPLYTIIDQERYLDYIKTFLEMYKIGGRLPQWELAGNYTGVMIGYHTHSCILEAQAKGIAGFNAELALEAMVKRVANIGYYKDLGYIPADKSGGSVSKVMEYSFNDWCVAQMGKHLDNHEVYDDYMQRARFYQNMFDPSTGFMRPKNLDGSWVSPFDPAEGSDHFVEGNSYQYSLFAPHDVNGLIDLIGGDEKFVAWLDALFTTESSHDEDVIDATGLIGQYAHGNEPSHHMAYLYNYAGAPWKTQTMVRKILETMYDDKPDGLSGNEDCGQMSAWYILSSMGFYPVCPGDTNYVIGTPIFDQISINLENGNQVSITVKNANLENPYIQSMSLNGRPYNKSYISHQELMKGTTIEFEMGNTPNEAWGSSPESRPSTGEFETFSPLPKAYTEDSYFLDKAIVELSCPDANAEIYYTIDGSRPTLTSQVYNGPIELQKTAEVRFRSHSNKPGVAPSLPVSVKVTQLEFEDFTNYEGTKKFKKGLEYKYFHAHVMEEHGLDELVPIETGILPNFTIDNRKREDYIGYIYSGYLDIPRDGIYTFHARTNDGMTLYLDGKPFFRGGYKTIALRKGKYKIDQKYFQLGARKFNIVGWKGPGIPEQEIPAGALFH